VRQTLKPGRLTLVSMACAALLAACGGGSDSGNGEGRLQVVEFSYPGGGTLLAASRTLSATASSGLPVSFRSETPTYCTVSGDQVTLVAAGECRVVASQEGGTTADGSKWARADEISHLFIVLKHPQTVELAVPDYVLSTATSEFTVVATASSGLPPTISAGTPGVCSMTGNQIKVLGKGSCVVTATQAGDANYAQASVARPVAVDPLLVADGILGAGPGTTSSAMTKQGGAVTANPWSQLIEGWEWCPDTHPTECFRTVSPDERTFTSALRISDAKWKATGWHFSYNNIDIFTPGLSGFNPDGDTTGGLQVTTETVLAATLGVNPEFIKAGKPVVVQLDLGKRNGSCNVTASTLLWPFPFGAGDAVSYAIPLDSFAVTEACGLAGVDAVSLDNDVRALPTYWGTSLSDTGAQQAYLNALNADAMKKARVSATAMFVGHNIVRVRFRVMDVNLTITTGGGDVLATDLSIVGAITLQ